MPQPLYISREAAAKQLGVSTSALTKWAKQPWFVLGRCSKDRKYCPELIAKHNPGSGSKRPTKGQVQASGAGQGSLKTQLECEKLEVWILDASTKLCRELGLLLPRQSIETTMAMFFGAVRDFCEELPKSTHQIPRDPTTGEYTAEIFKEWLIGKLQTWQRNTVSRGKRILQDLGPMPRLQDLISGVAKLTPPTEGEDQDVV